MSCFVFINCPPCQGIPADELPKEVDRMIRQVGLVEKRKVFSKNLSGGMKRKLSVGIALLGSSKVSLFTVVYLLLPSQSSGSNRLVLAIEPCTCYGVTRSPGTVVTGHRVTSRVQKVYGNCLSCHCRCGSYNRCAGFLLLIGIATAGCISG